MTSEPPPTLHPAVADSNWLAHVAQTLREQDIDHGRLRQTRRYTAAPLSVTDDRYIVAHAFQEKLTVAKEIQLSAATSRRYWAGETQHGWTAQTVKGLPVLAEDDHYYWAVFPNIPSQPNYSDAVPATTAISAVEELTALHRADPTTLPELASLAAGDGWDRTKELGFIGAFDKNIARTLEEALVYTAHSTPVGHLEVPSHGQPAMEVFCSSPDGGFYTGYRRSLLAPALYDWAAVRHHLMRIGGNDIAWSGAVQWLTDQAFLEDEQGLDTFENLYAVLTTIDSIYDYLHSVLPDDEIRRAKKGNSTIPWMAVDPDETILIRVSEVGLLAKGLPLSGRAQRLPEVTA